MLVFFLSVLECCCFDLDAGMFVVCVRELVCEVNELRWLESQNGQREMVIIIAFGECSFLFISFDFFSSLWCEQMLQHMWVGITDIYTICTQSTWNACFYFHVSFRNFMLDFIFIPSIWAWIENFCSLYIVFAAVAAIAVAVVCKSV